MCIRDSIYIYRHYLLQLPFYFNNVATMSIFIFQFNIEITIWEVGLYPDKPVSRCILPTTTNLFFLHGRSRRGNNYFMTEPNPSSSGVVVEGKKRRSLSPIIHKSQGPPVWTICDQTRYEIPYEIVQHIKYFFIQNNMQLHCIMNIVNQNKYIKSYTVNQFLSRNEKSNERQHQILAFTILVLHL